MTHSPNPASPPGAGEDLRAGIYMASKTVHAPRWREMRSDGLPIISTWIDEAGKGETSCFKDLWRRCVSEACAAQAVIVYREPGEVLKGAFVEVGAALAKGVPVYAIGCEEFSFVNHTGVTICGSVEQAAIAALAAVPHPTTAPADRDVAALRELSEKATPGRFGVELSHDGDALWLGSLREDGVKLEHIIYGVSGLLGYRAEYAKRVCYDADFLAAAGNRVRTHVLQPAPAGSGVAEAVEAVARVIADELGMFWDDMPANGFSRDFTHDDLRRTALAIIEAQGRGAGEADVLREAIAREAKECRKEAAGSAAERAFPRANHFNAKAEALEEALAGFPNSFAPTTPPSPAPDASKGA